MLKVIILAGGSGKRLWPLSRDLMPKQFLSIVEPESMLQTTLKRLSHLCFDSVKVVCNEEQRFLVLDQIGGEKCVEAIILEPCQRNTAPAIAAAALNEDPNTTLLILPSDHLIENDENFVNSVMNARALADEGCLVAFGIKPSGVETGYGYLKKGKREKQGFQIDKFVEKPSYQKAKEYVNSKEYFWNSGFYLFKAGVYLNELKKYEPKVFESCESAVAASSKDLEFIRLDKKLFSKCPSGSIDTMVMERTDNAMMQLLDAGWRDIGSWSAVYDSSARDENNNVIKGNIIAHKTSKSYLRNDKGILVTIGLDDLLVVVNKNAVLVANKNSSEDLKVIDGFLDLNDHDNDNLNYKVHRPWGFYECIDRGEGFKVKKIRVKPMKRLSLQKHAHRSEHWVVVTGEAEVIKNKECFTLSQNQSIYIPAGMVHRLSNITNKTLEIIEVQTGSILDEEDIIRLDDDYGRH